MDITQKVDIETRESKVFFVVIDAVNYTFTFAAKMMSIKPFIL